MEVYGTQAIVHISKYVLFNSNHTNSKALIINSRRQLVIEMGGLKIDNPFMDERSSGLALTIEGFIKEDNFCYLHLCQSCRSRLAEQADTLL